MFLDLAILLIKVGLGISALLILILVLLFFSDVPHELKRIAKALEYIVRVLERMDSRGY